VRLAHHCSSVPIRRGRSSSPDRIKLLSGLSIEPGPDYYHTFAGSPRRRASGARTFIQSG
jgi:hypothetical protein